MIHVLGVVLVTALILGGTLLPFVPGEYDPAAVPLSVMLQFVAFPALLLVPVGLLLAASRYSPGLAAKQRVLFTLAVLAASVVWAAASLAAFLFSTILSGFVAALGIGLLMVVRRWHRGATRLIPAIGMYFIVVPVAVIALQYALIPKGIEFSRSRAIRNSQELIADVERYHTANGRFPVSLLAMRPDYKPAVIGIEKYHYEPNGHSYNVFFEQLAYQFGTQEIVMYNPRNEHQATAHAMDILQYPLEQLNRARGYYAVHDTRHPQWKLFWFD